jgi:hypothetical protein
MNTIQFLELNKFDVGCGTLLVLWAITVLAWTDRYDAVMSRSCLSVIFWPDFHLNSSLPRLWSRKQNKLLGLSSWPTRITRISVWVDWFGRANPSKGLDYALFHFQIPLMFPVPRIFKCQETS